MKKVVWGLVVLLAILHQDFWFWDRIEPLIFGFTPIGLAYHVGISLAAAAAWALATVYCWPHELEVTDADSAAPRRQRGEL
jgi:hypothetical protein